MTVQKADKKMKKLCKKYAKRGVDILLKTRYNSRNLG